MHRKKKYSMRVDICHTVCLHIYIYMYRKSEKCIERKNILCISHTEISLSVWEMHIVRKVYTYICIHIYIYKKIKVCMYAIYIHIYICVCIGAHTVRLFFFLGRQRRAASTAFSGCCFPCIQFHWVRRFTCIHMQFHWVRRWMHVMHVLLLHMHSVSLSCFTCIQFFFFGRQRRAASHAFSGGLNASETAVL